MKTIINMKTVPVLCLLIVTAITVHSKEKSEATVTDKVPQVAHLSKDQISGNVFKQKEARASKYKGSTPVIDFTSMISSNEKFTTGMYSSGPLHESYEDAYGSDEFFYIISGKITLTSEDGTVTVVNPGEAVSIPKEWRGQWDTDGYNKIYVMYVE
jgi:uncharacterized cupin superfamily protein